MPSSRPSQCSRHSGRNRQDVIRRCGKQPPMEFAVKKPRIRFRGDEAPDAASSPCVGQAGPRTRYRSRPYRRSTPMNPDQPYCFLICAFEETPEALQVRRDGIDRAHGAVWLSHVSHRRDSEDGGGHRGHARSHRLRGLRCRLTAGATAIRSGLCPRAGRPIVHLINANETPQFNVAGLQFLRYNSPAQLRELPSAIS